MAPILRGDKAHFSADVVALKGLGRSLDVLREERAAAVSMQLQFLDALGKRAEITEQPVLLFAGLVQKVKRAGNHHPVNDTADENQNEHAHQYLPRKPSKEAGTPEKHGGIDEDNRDGEEGLSDVEDVIGQSHEQA